MCNLFIFLNCQSQILQSDSLLFAFRKTVAFLSFEHESLSTPNALGVADNGQMILRKKHLCSYCVINYTRVCLIMRQK